MSHSPALGSARVACLSLALALDELVAQRTARWHHVLEGWEGPHRHTFEEESTKLWAESCRLRQEALRLADALGAVDALGA